MLPSQETVETLLSLVDAGLALWFLKLYWDQSPQEALRDRIEKACSLSQAKENVGVTIDYGKVRGKVQWADHNRKESKSKETKSVLKATYTSSCQKDEGTPVYEKVIFWIVDEKSKKRVTVLDPEKSPFLANELSKTNFMHEICYDKNSSSNAGGPEEKFVTEKMLTIGTNLLGVGQLQRRNDGWFLQPPENGVTSGAFYILTTKTESEFQRQLVWWRKAYRAAAIAFGLIGIGIIGFKFYRWGKHYFFPENGTDNPVANQEVPEDNADEDKKKQTRNR